MNNKEFRKFALAGNARFSLKSKKTGKRLRFRIYKLPIEQSNTSYSPWFVYIKKPNGVEKFIGTIKAAHGRFWWSKNSSYHYNSTVVKSFLWLWNNRNGWKERAEITNICRCGRCGKHLTTDSSRDIGLGPTCDKKATDWYIYTKPIKKEAS